MNTRLLTVGSLIPRNIIVEKIVEHKQPKIERPQTYQIGLLQNQKEFTVHPTKGNLLDAALHQGQALQYKCRKGTCGMCTVKVVEGTSCLSAPNQKEHKKLKQALHDGYRLACQAEII